MLEAKAFLRGTLHRHSRWFPNSKERLSETDPSLKASFLTDLDDSVV
jgi:hypothetical protein